MAFVSVVAKGGALPTATQFILNTDYIVHIQKIGSFDSDWSKGMSIRLDKAAGSIHLALQVFGTQVEHILEVLGLK